MSEKKYKQLRQRLKYKPTYAGRKYRLLDRIIQFIRRGKWVNKRKDQLLNVGIRADYRKAKQEMKR